MLGELNYIRCLLIKNEQKGFLINNEIKKIANNLSEFLYQNNLQLFKNNITSGGGMEVPQISGKMWHWEKDVHTKSDASLQKDYRKFYSNKK